MKKETCIFLILIAVLSLMDSICESGDTIDLGGFVETNHFFGLQENEIYNYGNTNIIGIKISAYPNDHIAAVGNFELRNTNFPDVFNAEDMGNRSKVEPLILRIEEAYGDYYGFIFKNLDLRIGKQRIAWGTADGFNPTDYFGPFDLENPLDFKKRLGVTGLRATYYFRDDVQFEAVYVPLFTPSILPVSVFGGGFPVDLPMDVAISNMESHVETPETRVANMQVGYRLSWFIWRFDMSVSYYMGRHVLPVPYSADVPSFQILPDGITADVDVRMYYPKTQAAGFDFACSIKGIGFRGEGAVYFPEKVDMDLTVLGESIDPLTGEPLESINMVEDKPYFKGAFGIEYTFKGGYYFQIQYLHGFFTELSSRDIEDYLLGIFKKKFLNDSLEIEIMGGGEFDDTDKLGWIAGGELHYMPFDSTKITLGGIAARGHEGTNFNLFEELDQVYVRARLDF